MSHVSVAIGTSLLPGLLLLASGCVSQTEAPATTIVASMAPETPVSPFTVGIGVNCPYGLRG